MCDSKCPRRTCLTPSELIAACVMEPSVLLSWSGPTWCTRGAFNSESPVVRPAGEASDACLGGESGSEGMECTMARGHRARAEAEGCTQESAARVEHGLFDDLVGPGQHRLRDRQAEALRRLEIDDQLEFGRLLDGEVTRFSTIKDLRDVPS